MHSCKPAYVRSADLINQHEIMRRLDKTKFLYVGAGLFSVSAPAHVSDDTLF